MGSPFRDEMVRASNSNSCDPAIAMCEEHSRLKWRDPPEIRPQPLWLHQGIIFSSTRHSPPLAPGLSHPRVLGGCNRRPTLLSACNAPPEEVCLQAPGIAGPFVSNGRKAALATASGTTMAAATWFSPKVRALLLVGVLQLPYGGVAAPVGPSISTRTDAIEGEVGWGDVTCLPEHPKVAIYNRFVSVCGPRGILASLVFRFRHLASHASASPLHVPVAGHKWEGFQRQGPPH